MCCFTIPIKSVKTTRIFARAWEKERQFLVYSMQVEADAPVAMILPLPVNPGTGEDGVTFINLKEYPEFFHDLQRGFPRKEQRAKSDHNWRAMPASAAMPLRVAQVGNFEASFVPTINDFSRLDARFRLPDGVWEKLPGYHDYGFAVFKLKPGLQDVHPMAFSFPRRDLRFLFFPTVHIHDGKVHQDADFDHTLFAQPREGEFLKFDQSYDWQESAGHARSFMQLAKAQKLIEADQHCYRRTMNGQLPNKDTFVPLET